MALRDALDQADEALRRLAERLAALSRQSIVLEIRMTGPGSDRQEAEAIKRGQRPEQIAALRKVLTP